MSLPIKVFFDLRCTVQLAELRSRGWSKADLVGLAGGNLIRVWQGVEAVALRMQSGGVQPAFDVYDKREDL
jgi:membrane dipeptidase